MSRSTAYLVLLLCAGVILPVGYVFASAWSTPIWSVAPGGGGVSSGPNNVVEMTIGQPVAGLSSGGANQVQSGFLFTPAEATPTVPPGSTATPTATVPPGSTATPTPTIGPGGANYFLPFESKNIAGW